MKHYSEELVEEFQVGLCGELRFSDPFRWKVIDEKLFLTQKIGYPPSVITIVPTGYYIMLDGWRQVSARHESKDHLERLIEKAKIYYILGI